MGNNVCPACRQPIAIGDINIKEGVGLCRACGKLSRLGEIADQQAVDAKALTMPPDGCSYEQRPGGGFLVRATLRSLSTAGGLLFFCVFWNGILSVFLLVVGSSLYTHFIGPLPEWFPAPSSSKHDNSGMPLGMTLFLCVFLTPFVLVGATVFLATLSCLFGRVEVTSDGTEGRVRTGCGPFNWTRRFDATDVTRVGIGASSWQSNGKSQQLVQIETTRRNVKFGAMLNDTRREWVRGVLQLSLVTQAKQSRTARVPLPRILRA